MAKYAGTTPNHRMGSTISSIVVGIALYPFFQSVSLSQRRALLLTEGADDGAARLPPMGWRSWNYYACEISQEIFERQIDALVDESRSVDGVATSLRDIGYNTVGIDDCWQDCLSPLSLNGSYHSSTGDPLVDKERFPKGLRALSDYGAKRGIKLGWYGNNCDESSGPGGRGPKYCSENGKLETDWPLARKGDVRALLAANFSSIKLDNPNCGANGDLAAYYNEVKEQQRRTSGSKNSQPIIIENCHYNTSFPHWIDRPGGKLACPMHLYRVSNDIKANWAYIMGNAAATIPFANSGMSRPGCWAYPDMLEIGVRGQNDRSEGNLSFTEQRTHLGLWQIISSPLTLSFDLGNATLMDEMWPLITNPEALAVSQSWHGHSGSLAAEDTDQAGKKWQVYSKPQANGAVAVLMISRALDMGKDLPPIDLSLQLSSYVDISGGDPHVRDIWNRRDIQIEPGTGEDDDLVLRFPNVPAHDSVFLLITPA